MAEISFAGTHIGGWCNMGCVFVLEEESMPVPSEEMAKMIADAEVTAGHRGYMQIAQGGDPNYGQKTNVVVFYSGTSVFIERDCGNDIIQRSTMADNGVVNLAGTDYYQFSGPTNGPGTGGKVSVIRVLK